MAAMIGQVAPDMELEIYKNGEAVCTTLLSLRTTGILVEKKIKKNVLFFCWCVCVCVFFWLCSILNQPFLAVDFEVMVVCFVGIAWTLLYSDALRGVFVTSKLS